MYTITPSLRKSRKLDEPGYILIRVRGKDLNERHFATGISSTAEDMTTVHRDTVLRWIKAIYDVIERLQYSGKDFSIDDIAEDFRKIKPEEIEAEDISNFKVSRDVASIGRLFKKMVVTAKSDEDAGFDGKNLTIRSLTSYIGHLLNTDASLVRYGTVANYKSTSRALNEFILARLSYGDAIDKEFIHSFNKWLIETKKVSASTASFYLRMLRAVLNKAKYSGLIEMPDNWFKGLVNSHNAEYDFSKQATLSKPEINMIATIRIEDDPLMELSRDMFMFSFYCRGMELFDIFNLTPENIHGDLIVYNKRITGKQQIIKIEPPASRILSKYLTNAGDYIFSAIKNYSKSREYNTLRRIIMPKLTVLGKILEIKIPLTFSVARNTWTALANESNLSSMMLK